MLAGTVPSGPATACSDDDDWPVPDGEAPVLSGPPTLRVCT